MKHQSIVSRWLLPSLISALLICLMLSFAPKIEMAKAFDFKEGNIGTNFINSENSAKIEALNLYDFQPIFLPTNFNVSTKPPSEINIDSFKDINNTDSFSQDPYISYVLNKKESSPSKINNIFYANIRELMPYYKVEDYKDLVQSKSYINISIIDTKNGEEIASENIEMGNKHNNFFVPTEIFMSVGNNLNINIVDNISSPSLESSSAKLIKDTLSKTKIFNKLNSGYYKLIISP